MIIIPSAFEVLPRTVRWIVCVFIHDLQASLTTLTVSYLSEPKFNRLAFKFAAFPKLSTCHYPHSMADLVWFLWK